MYQFKQCAQLLAVIVMTALLAAGCASSGMSPPAVTDGPEDEASFNPYDPSQMPKAEYRIRRGDGLSLRFLYNSELNISNMQVREDGMISVPVIGDVAAAGKTPAELETAIQISFADFIERTGHGSSLKAGDSMQIRFTYNPQLNQRVVVRPDGMVSLLKLGEVKADGVTFSDFEKNVLEGYRTFIRDPEMSIFLLTTQTSRIYADAGDLSVLVTNPQPKEVFIGGEVGNPTVIRFTDWMTPMQALSQAGGLEPGSDGSRVVYITQGPQGEAITSLINLDDYLNSGRKLNLYLRHGDILLVPRSGVAKLNLAVQQYIRDALPISTSFGFSYPLRRFSSSDEQNDSQVRVTTPPDDSDTGGTN